LLRKVSVITLASLLAVTVYAQVQNGTAISSFQEEAAYRSTLYRGRGVPEYRTILFNGTPYWDKPDFTPGTLVVDGRRYDNVLMNIDAHRQEIHVKYAEGMSAVLLDRSRVTECGQDGYSYVNLEARGIPKAAPGYYKVLSDNPVRVYQRVDKLLKTSPDSVNGTPIGYYDTAYRTNAIKYYYRDESYWYISKDGRLKRTGKGKALKMAGYAK